MFNAILTGWFLIILIFASYGIYKLLSCIDYTKFVYPEKLRFYKMLLTILSIILGFLLALCFTNIVERIYSVFIN